MVLSSLCHDLFLLMPMCIKAFHGDVFTQGCLSLVHGPTGLMQSMGMGKGEVGRSAALSLIVVRRLSQWYHISLGLAAARRFSGWPCLWWLSSHLRSPHVEGDPPQPLRCSPLRLSRRCQAPQPRSRSRRRPERTTSMALTHEPSPSKPASRSRLTISRTSSIC